MKHAEKSPQGEDKPKSRKRRRFHFFDYLWWTGEKLSPLATHVDGGFVIWMFTVMPFILPIAALATQFGLSVTLLLILISAVSFVPMFIISGLYPKQRRTAVMRYYSKQTFERFPATMLCLLPFLLLLIEAALITDFRHKSQIGNSRPEISALPVNKALLESMHEDSQSPVVIRGLRLLGNHPDLKRLGIPKEVAVIDSASGIHEFQVELLNKYPENEIFAGKHRFLQVTWSTGHPDTLLTIWYEIRSSGLNAADSCRYDAATEF